MPSSSNKRLTKLEQAVKPPQATCATAQVVIYNPVTGEPLTPIDDKAFKWIWIPGEASELEKYSR